MKADGTDAKQEQSQAPAKRDTIGAMIERMKPQIAKALPSSMTPERMARVVLTALRNNPKLQQCNPLSLMGAVMTSAQLGLEPNTPLGLCYLIPYKDEATFQMGYKGIIELAHRSGQYRRISAQAVDKADKFHYAYGLAADLVHVPSDQPTGEITHYYAVYELANGGRDFVVWSAEKVTAHAKKYSKSYTKADSAWQTAPEAMGKKTVLIDLLKFAPKSVEMAKAATYDDQVVRFDEANAELDAVLGEYEEVTE